MAPQLRPRAVLPDYHRPVRHTILLQRGPLLPHLSQRQRALRVRVEDERVGRAGDGGGGLPREAVPLRAAQCGLPPPGRGLHSSTSQLNLSRF